MELDGDRLAAAGQREAAGWRDYVAMARPDHWVKHIFILPGVALALVAEPVPARVVALPLLVGLAAACLAASANYVLNEWLDAEFDRHHPSKAARPAVVRRISKGIVVAEYLALVALSLLAAATVSVLFVYAIAAFVISGLIYNVKPIRTKDRPFLDVASEAINNPVRLTLGWAMVSPTTLPPASALMAYWMGGAFLMAIKRLAEFHEAALHGQLPELTRYRKSFEGYSETRLLLSAFLYAQMSAFFLAVFLIKYRIEYLISLPFFALLFAVYFRIGLKANSAAQQPERLYKEWELMLTAAVLCVVLVVLSWVDIPVLERLTEPHFLVID